MRNLETTSKVRDRRRCEGPRVRPGRPREGLRRTPCLERLEGRQLLAVTATVDAQGVLSVISDSADTIALDTNGAGDVTINGADPSTGAFPSASVTGIAIQGGPGANLIDFSAFHIADFSSLDALTVDGGGGDDTLAGPDASSDYYITGPDSGVLAGAGFGTLSISTFQAIPNLTGGTAANGFHLGAGAGLTGAIHGGGAGDALDLGLMDGPLSVALAGSTAQGFQGTASFLGAGFDGIAGIIGPLDQGTLIGEGVAGTWTLNGSPTYSDGAHTLSFQNFQTLQAGDGGDTFEIIGDANEQVTADLIGGSGGDTFQFHGAAQLVGNLQGNGGTDVLSYAAYGSSVNVQLSGSAPDGYGGTEAASFSGSFAGIDEVIASPAATGSSILTGDDQDSTWDLTAQTYTDTSGLPLAYSGFSIFQGGAGADTFDATADVTADLLGGAGDDVFHPGAGVVLTGTIDGQAGVDTLDLSAYTTDLKAHLLSSGVDGFGGDFSGSATVPVTGGFLGIDGLDGGTGANTLYGRDVASTWSLGATRTYADGTASLDFSGFGTLQGGTAADRFDVTAAVAAQLRGGDGTDTFAFGPGGSLTGSIAGEAGVNTLLDTSSGPFNVTLTGYGTTGFDGDATPVSGGFSDIAVIQAGTGTADTLGGLNVPSTWALGASQAYTDDASHTLTFSGFEALQGGSAADEFDVTTSTAIDLRGGSGDDAFRLGQDVVVTGAVDGGPGVDTLSLTGYSTGGVVARLTASDASGFAGTFAGGTAIPVTGGFGGIDVLLSGSSTGELIGRDVASTWTLGATQTYTDGTATLTFDPFVTLQAGSGGDLFLVNAATAADLRGGTGDDTFTMNPGGTLTGSISGGGGRDSLIYAVGTPVQVILTGSGAAGFNGDATAVSGGFSGISVLQGGTGSTDSLTGLDLPGTWTLGVIQTYTDSGGRVLTFSRFESLQGGAAADTFDVVTSTTADLLGGGGDDSFAFADGAVLHGSLDGQGGVNTLDLSGVHQATQVNLAAGTASMIDGAMANIRNVIGGTADNTITGDAADNALTSNGILDQLAGGPGSDAYVLNLPPGSSTTVTDSVGDNSLDFSGAGTGITLDLDSTAVQTIAAGRQIQLAGRFTALMGTPFADQINVSATTYDRTIVGGPAGGESGDVLRVDAGGRIARITPTAVLIEGMGTIAYSRFSRVILVNQAQSDLVLSQSHSPDPALLQEPLTIVLTVTNGGPSDATQVVLTDELPAGMTIVSASSSQGSVSSSGSTVTASLGGLAVGATATVRIIVTPQAVGSFVNSAVVVAHEPNPNPDHARSTATIDVIPNGTLQITSQSREGSGWQPTQVILDFNAALDASSATDLVHYTLVGPGRDGRLGTRDDVRIAIRSAGYDAAAHTVTLTSAARLNLHRAYLITVRGVVSSTGNVLDGYANGRPGSPYRAVFHGYRAFRHLAPRGARPAIRILPAASGRG